MTPAPPPPIALGDAFYDVVAGQFPELTLRYRNQRAAASVGLDGADRRRSGSPISAASRRCPAACREPLALRYHGHQFRAYNPDLGDGRGFLFAQLDDDRRPPARSRHQGLGPDAVVAHAATAG